MCRASGACPFLQTPAAAQALRECCVVWPSKQSVCALEAEERESAREERENERRELSGKREKGLGDERENIDVLKSSVSRIADDETESKVDTSAEASEELMEVSVLDDISRAESSAEVCVWGGHALAGGGRGGAQCGW